MFANILILVMNVAGLYYTSTRRKTAGASQVFDLASLGRYPKAYKLTIALRLIVFGIGFVVAIYRIIFGITD